MRKASVRFDAESTLSTLVKQHHEDLQSQIRRKMRERQMEARALSGHSHGANPLQPIGRHTSSDSAKQSCKFIRLRLQDSTLVARRLEALREGR